MKQHKPRHTPLEASSVPIRRGVRARHLLVVLGWMVGAACLSANPPAWTLNRDLALGGELRFEISPRPGERKGHCDDDAPVRLHYVFEGESDGWDSRLSMVADSQAHVWVWAAGGASHFLPVMELQSGGELTLFSSVEGRGILLDASHGTIAAFEDGVARSLIFGAAPAAFPAGLEIGLHEGAPRGGSLQWTGNDLQGFDGSTWRSLFAPEPEPERDPSFHASAAATIDLDSIARWNDAVEWGDHDAAGYLVAELDADPLNEVVQDVRLVGTVLEVEDAAGIHPVELESLLEQVPEPSRLCAPGGSPDVPTVALSVDTTGKVGIGTTQPAAQLHVAGSVVIDGPLYVQPSPEIPVWDPGN